MSHSCMTRQSLGKVRVKGRLVFKDLLQNKFVSRKGRGPKNFYVLALSWTLTFKEKRAQAYQNGGSDGMQNEDCDFNLKCRTCIFTKRGKGIQEQWGKQGGMEK